MYLWINTKRILLLCIYMYYMCDPVVGQKLLDNLLIIDESKGLPSNEVTAATIDNQGFLWIGTTEGLCRWDGNKIRTYRNIPGDPTSVAGNEIKYNALLWHAQSRQLFIGTDKGLSIYNPYGDQFTNYITGDSSEYQFDGKINTIATDRQGGIWIGTSEGLKKMVENQFNSYDFSATLPKEHKYSFEQINDIHDIVQDLSNDSILWVSNLGGIWKFNQYTEKIERFLLESENMIYSLNHFTDIVPHPNGKLYIRTWNEDMVIFNTHTLTFEKHIGPLASGNNYYPNALLPGPVADGDKIWITSKEGVGFFDTRTEKVDYLESFTNEGGKKIRLLIPWVDDHQMVAITEYGLYLFDLKIDPIQNYFLSFNDEELFYLPGDHLEIPEYQVLLLGFIKSDNLYQFDLNSHDFAAIKTPMDLDKYHTLRSFLDTEGQRLALTKSGLYQLDHNDLSFITITTSSDDNDYNDIIKDNRGRIWVSGKRSGIQVLENHQLKSVFDWNKIHRKANLPTEIIIMEADNHDRIWFALNSGSYGYFISDKSEVKIFEEYDNKISFLKSWNQDTLWVGTLDDGLKFILPDDPESGLHDTSGFVNSRQIYDMEMDSENRFWILTNDGLIRDERNGNVNIFSENYGLARYHSWFNRDPIFRGKIGLLNDGRMIVQYRGGVGLFHPDSLMLKAEDFQVYVSELKANNKGVKLKNMGLDNQEIYLDHQQSNLQIRYSVFDQNRRNEYNLSHQMKGVDPDWVVTASKEISYANLSPGTYQFCIKAERITGLFDTEERCYKIDVASPWWANTWAYIFYALGLGGISFFFFNYYRKRKEAEREAMRLKELDEVKNHIYTNITHEFRTPLTVIMGMAEEIERKTSDNINIDVEGDIDAIKRNGQNLLGLVNQMLDLSRLKSGNISWNCIHADVIPFINMIVESFQQAALAKDIKIHLFPEMKNLWMDYDPEKFQAIISNLISNALKFNHKGGDVYIHLTSSEEEDRDWFYIRIKDNGQGIDKEELNQIFERFFQGSYAKENQIAGSGVGLSLVKEFIEIRGGNISVKSKQGHGTEFIVKLPVRCVETDEKCISLSNGNYDDLAESNLNESGNTNGPLLLVVEDNSDVAEYISSCVKEEYQIIYAENGKAGLAKAIEKVPDIIISDVMMPLMDGYEMCARIKENELTSHIPIVLLTALAQEKNKITGYASGADAYLIKPFNRKELLIRLDQLVKVRKELQKKYSEVNLDALQYEMAKDEGEKKFLNKVIHEIEKAIDDPKFSRVVLAKKLGLSESQLHRKLKAVTGKSTSIFIRHIRLLRAKKLLQQPDAKINEVAYDVGFSDTSYFSRTFKEEFGKSPSEIIPNK